MYAVGIGVYGSYNYGSLEPKLDDSDGADDTMEWKSTLMGGGLVLDTAVAKDSLFNYRLQIGGAMLNFKDDEYELEFETYQVSFLNSFARSKRRSYTAVNCIGRYNLTQPTWIVVHLMGAGHLNRTLLQMYILCLV